LLNISGLFGLSNDFSNASMSTLSILPDILLSFTVKIKLIDTFSSFLFLVFAGTHLLNLFNSSLIFKDI